MNRVKNRHIQTMCLYIVATSFGGCSALDGFWQKGQSFGQRQFSALGQLLRPAPKPVEIFEARRDTKPAKPRPEHTEFQKAHMRAFMKKYALPVTANKPETRTVMSRTLEHGVQVYRPGAYPVQRAGRVIDLKRPSRPSQTLPATNLPQTAPKTAPQIIANLRPQSDPYQINRAPKAEIENTPTDQENLAGAPKSDTDQLSYVKIGGGANMADWQLCQKQAGEIALVGRSGYRINPEFDQCMRAKNYLPEQEALKALQTKD